MCVFQSVSNIFVNEAPVKMIKHGCIFYTEAIDHVTIMQPYLLFLQDLKMFGVTLSACGQQWSLALALMEQMELEQLVPGQIAYNSVVPGSLVAFGIVVLWENGTASWWKRSWFTSSTGDVA